MSDPIEPRFDQHMMRYGELISTDLREASDSPYTEAQCGDCPYGHRCCELVVMATPAEAAGILQWLSLNAEDVAAVARAVQLRASVLGEHFKKFGKDQAAAIAAWYQKGLKCVFYDVEARDGEGGCSIYPVRPMACRRVFGDGDCESDEKRGIHSAPDQPRVLTARVSRFKIHPDPQQNVAELTSVVAHMATSREEMYVDHEFFTRDPATLTDDQVIFGLAGAPTPNPVALEVPDGSPIRPVGPGSEPGA